MSESFAELALSALSFGDVNGFLAIVPADEREIIEMPAGIGGIATIVRVGTVTLRSVGDGAFDAHQHPTAEVARECFRSNVDSARGLLSQVDTRSPVAALMSLLQAVQERQEEVTDGSVDGLAVGRVSMSDIPYTGMYM